MKKNKTQRRCPFNVSTLIAIRTWISSIWCGLAVVSLAGWVSANADEAPYGKGMTDANKQRLVLDDMEDVADWYNGSPDETNISASDRHVKGGPTSLLFANRVDHTKGETNYPVGWPRTGKDLAREKLTDWSDFDAFECWIYAETSRPALPKKPLGVGFYHSGHKRSSHVPLIDIKKDAWVKVVIPVSDLLDPKDVRRVQFNISESDYQHGDRVDCYIDDMVLTRYVEPAVAELRLSRRILFSHDRYVRAEYDLVGYRDLDTTRAELAIGRPDQSPAVVVHGQATHHGELVLPIDKPLVPGTYRATLGLRDAHGELIDRKHVEFRAIAGPFEEDSLDDKSPTPCSRADHVLLACTPSTRPHDAVPLACQRRGGDEHRQASGITFREGRRENERMECAFEASDNSQQAGPAVERDESGVLANNTLRFDLGTAESELRPGFTRVTARSLYTKETGYGWKSSDGLREQHQHYSRAWTYSESRGREQPPPIYTNEVTCDCVTGDRPNSLLIDLSPGAYEVWLLCGRSAGSARDYHDFDVSIGGGQQGAATSVKIAGPYRFEKRVFRVKPAGSQLSIDFTPRTDWMLAGVVVFPVDEADTVRREFLDALEKEIFFLPPDVVEKWKKTEHVDDRPPPDLSETDRRRGFALFARHWSEVVYPNTVPRAEELNPELSAFAAPGEYEPVTFTVLPLENLAGAKVTASELRSGDAVIPAANVDVRAVRYMLVRPNYSSYYSYHEAPDVLEHRESVEIERGRNQRFWATVLVPEDAQAGTYEGRLTFHAAGRKPADVRLRLRVLPIRLRKDGEPIYGTYYRDPLSNLHEGNSDGANAYFRRKAESERQDMVTHGMNSHISHVSGLTRDEQGNWTMDGAETDRRIALDRKYGLADKPLVVSFPVGWWYSKLVDPRGTGSHLRLVRGDVPESFYAEVTKMVEAIEREKGKYDWPELLYYPIDEPSTRAESVRFMVGVLQAIKRVPGVRTYVTADPSHEQFAPMWPYVDVWCCQPFVFGHDKIRELSQQKNIEFWCYPNHISGENDHTPVRGARMTWGFGFWKSGFRALIPWIYQASVGDPWNYLDGTSMDFFNRSTPEGQPVPVTMWEAYREGIDDGRYLYTLKQLIAENQRRGGRPAELAASAERELQFVWDSIEAQEKYKYDGLWSGADFDAYRWLLASQILALQETGD